MSPFDAEIFRIALPFSTVCHCYTAHPAAAAYDNATTTTTLVANDSTHVMHHNQNEEVVGSNVQLQSVEVFIRHDEQLRMFSVVVCVCVFCVGVRSRLIHFVFASIIRCGSNNT